MLTSLRGPLAATIIMTGVFAGPPVVAQTADYPRDNAADGVAAENATATAVADVPAEMTVTGSVALVTDYRFRGVSQSGGDPAIQGSITVTHASGLYASAWASSIDDGGTGTYGDMELDLSGGWSGEVGDGVSLDAGLLYYAYPTNARGVRAEFFEPYATVTGILGPVTAKAGVNYAWSQESLGDSDNLYLHTELSAGLPGTPLTLNGHLGYTDGPLAPPFLAGADRRNGFDWSLGASATVLGRLTLGFAYTGVEGPAIDSFTNDTVVGSLTLAF